jgi:NADH-quinone oxidoreductase subunit N
MILQANTTALYSIGDLMLIAPELILTIGACIGLVLSVLLPHGKKQIAAWFSLVCIFLSFVSLIFLWRGNPLPQSAFYGTIKIDGLAILFKGVLLIAAALTIAISIKFLDIENEQRSEYYALVLFATVGMMFMACGYDLIVLFISLETMALTFYVLVAFTKRDKRTNEAAMKYFLLGAFSSGLLLYGMSLLYGIAGSTNLNDIATAISTVVKSSNETSTLIRPLLLLGMISLAAGMFFKVSAVPFHQWTPDAYEGAPTPITAFLSTASKAASFIMFARLFLDSLAAMRVDWAPLLGIVAAITILVGNWGAVTQENSKRLLAYSSIANAGYLLLGLIGANEWGYKGLTIYLFVYVLMNIGAFGVVISLKRKSFVGEDVDDFAGLGQRAPFMAFMMTVFLLSLGGIPATGGFVGKFYLFGSLVQRGTEDGRTWYYVLAVWAVINTVVSFYYYVRFIRLMYLSEESRDESVLSPSLALQIALCVAVVGVIFSGIYPQPIISIAQSLVK